MNYQDFYNSYYQIQRVTPSYRLGQHFINLFVKDDSDELFQGLYNMDHQQASERIKQIVDAYQWDLQNLPLMDKQ